MARITLDNINVHYPVMADHYMSIRRFALRLASGGRMFREDGAVRLVHAVKNFSLTLKDGDRLGLVGRNGAGKSTLLRVLGGFILPTSGQMDVDGRVTSLFSAAGGMDIERTGYDNIFYVGRLYGLKRKEMEQHIPAIEEFSELGHFLKMPLRAYSEGMKVRLGIAIVTCLRPEILVLDEAIGAGDAHFIQKATARAERLYEQAKIIVIASHAPDILRRLCNRAVFIEKGEIKLAGNVDDVLNAYMAA